MPSSTLEVKMPDPLLTIGELACRAGVATSALRYWEELGLLPAPARLSGQRRYPASAASHVGVILLLRDAGFTLAEQKAFLASPAAAPGDWQQLARRKLAELDKQIAKAQAARKAIDHALACPHQDIRQCPNFASLTAARLTGQPLHQAHPH
jgi:DNA-binding transcriptional MerR regulator